MQMACETGLICLNCSAKYPLQPLFDGCPQCRTETFRSNLSITYDYERLRKVINRNSFKNESPGIWRFADMLPIENPSHFVSLHEGNTPLIPLQQVARKAGLKRVFAKDETRNPTLSYKDRFCAVATAKALDFGAQATTISSTGNHGSSAAAYASRAGLNCFVLTVTFTSQNMITQMMVYGGKLVSTHTFEGRWHLMSEGIRRYGWIPIGSFTIPPTGNPYGTEGYKTLGYEVAAQLNWTSPDWVIVPTAFGEGLYGIWKGFKELQILDLIDATPRMIAAAPVGCDPLRVSLDKNLDKVPILKQAKTVALSIGTYTTGHQGLVALRESQGEAVSVTDEEILQAQRLLALDGIFAEPASATSVAVGIKMGRSGKLDPESTVVCVITASGLKMPDEPQRYLHPPPVVEPDFEMYRQALEKTYHIHLE